MKSWWVAADAGEFPWLSVKWELHTSMIGFEGCEEFVLLFDRVELARIVDAALTWVEFVPGSNGGFTLRVDMENSDITSGSGSTWRI